MTEEITDFPPTNPIPRSCAGISFAPLFPLHASQNFADSASAAHIPATRQFAKKRRSLRNFHSKLNFEFAAQLPAGVQAITIADAPLNGGFIIPTASAHPDSVARPRTRLESLVDYRPESDSHDVRVSTRRIMKFRYPSAYWFSFIELFEQNYSIKQLRRCHHICGCSSPDALVSSTSIAHPHFGIAALPANEIASHCSNSLIHPNCHDEFPCFPFLTGLYRSHPKSGKILPNHRALINSMGNNLLSDEKLLSGEENVNNNLTNESILLLNRLEESKFPDHELINPDSNDSIGQRRSSKRFKTQKTDSEVISSLKSSLSSSLPSASSLPTIKMESETSSMMGNGDEENIGGFKHEQENNEDSEDEAESDLDDDNGSDSIDYAAFPIDLIDCLCEQSENLLEIAKSLTIKRSQNVKEELDRLAITIELVKKAKEKIDNSNQIGSNTTTATTTPNEKMRFNGNNGNNLD